MKRVILVAALLAATALATPPGWAARKSPAAAGQCGAQRSVEAEQAIRYMTDLMVASSACRNTTYAEFALRNRLVIIDYQKAMIGRLHGKAAFDRWNTSLANQAAMKEAVVPIAQFCQQAEPLMKQASALDTKGFRAFAAAQAAGASGQAAKCGK